MNHRFAVCLAGVLLLAGSSWGQKAPKPAITAAPSTTPPVVPTAPAAGMAPQDQSTYVIGASDVITVTVFKDPTLTGNLTVRPDGMISLPLLGDVPASGLTPMQLSVDLTKRLMKFMTDPNVTVTVVSVNSKMVYLIGEVSHIGPVQILPGMTPLQAIATAGGLTPYANARKIYILRGQQGKQTKILFDYKKALKEGNLQGVVLVPGDTIVVP
ncbi:MAG: polysaccharide biosynthesis/export family protein [Acidobacteriota bacterium]